MLALWSLSTKSAINMARFTVIVLLLCRAPFMTARSALKIVSTSEGVRSCYPGGVRGNRLFVVGWEWEGSRKITQS